jgi:Ca2+/H+ antiporter
LILLPLVASIIQAWAVSVDTHAQINIQANAAEHVTSVWMAAKDKMELTIAISLGSAIVGLPFHMCNWP